MKGRFNPLATAALMLLAAAPLMGQTSAKITELPAASSLSATDLVLTVTDPSGTPVTMKATIQKIIDLLGSTTLTLTNKTISGSSNTITGVPQSGVSNLVSDLAAKQPLDADLTSIAALTTASFGRDLLTLADVAALRTAAGLEIGSDVQAHSAALDAVATESPGNNKILGTDGSGVVGYYAAPVSSRVDVQVFDSAGSFTWTKPPGAVSVHRELLGGGGGGGSGNTGASSTARCGGGGGGAGARVLMVSAADELSATESVTVGAGGAGAAGVSASDSPGVNGSAGGASVFGGTTASGGAGGLGPDLADATNTSTPLAVTNGNFVYASTSNTAPGGRGKATTAGDAATAATTRSATGGGGGGGGTTGSWLAGGAGGSQGATPVGVVAGPSGGAGGLPGVNGTGRFGGGGGGGGGGAGGNGGTGAGGGGGGGNDNGSASGKGGNGGHGLVIITTYLAP